MQADFTFYMLLSSLMLISLILTNVRTIGVWPWGSEKYITASTVKTYKIWMENARDF